MYYRVIVFCLIATGSVSAMEKKGLDELVQNMEEVYGKTKVVSSLALGKASLKGDASQQGKNNQRVETLDQLLRGMQERFGVIDYSTVEPKVLTEIICREASGGQRVIAQDSHYLSNMQQGNPREYVRVSELWCKKWYVSQQQSKL